MNIETVRNSPWHAVPTNIIVASPTTMTATISMIPDGFPEDWQLEIQPRHFVLEPSKTQQVQVTIHPSGDPAKPIAGADPGTLVKARLVAVSHIDGEAEVYGGVGLWVNHRLSSTVTAVVSDHSSLSATVGGQLSVSSGAPTISGRTIGLQIKAPHKDVWVYAVTDASGNYSAAVETPIAGSYEIRAFYVGGDAVASARSAKLVHIRQ